MARPTKVTGKMTNAMSTGEWSGPMEHHTKATLKKIFDTVKALTLGPTSVFTKEAGTMVNGQATVRLATLMAASTQACLRTT